MGGGRWRRERNHRRDRLRVTGSGLTASSERDSLEAVVKEHMDGR